MTPTCMKTPVMSLESRGRGSFILGVPQGIFARRSGLRRERLIYSGGRGGVFADGSTYAGAGDLHGRPPFLPRVLQKMPLSSCNASSYRAIPRRRLRLRKGG